MANLQFNFEQFFNRATESDFHRTRLSQVLETTFPALTKDGPWLAGGAVRRLVQGQSSLDSDLDFFFNGETQFQDFATFLVGKGFKLKRETEHHQHYTGKITTHRPDESEAEFEQEINIQLVRFKYYDTAADVIDSFDFTICQFAYDGTTLTMGDLSLWDLARKRLVLHKLTYPVSTMRRLLKYQKQGYFACSGCLTELLARTINQPELHGQLATTYVD